MIEPVFEELAREKAKKGEGQVAFAKVVLGMGMGSMVAREYGVTATPTFVDFSWMGRRCVCNSSDPFLPSLPLSFSLIPADGWHAARRLMN